MLIVFFIALLFMFLFFPFKIRFAAHINLFDLKGFYALKLWRINVVKGKAYIDESKNFEIENAKNMFSGNISKEFKSSFLSNIFDELYVKKMELYFIGGITNDSFASAMMCGTALSMVETIYSIISMQYKDVKLYEDIKPTFNNNNFELSTRLVAQISIFQIILSAFRAIKTKKLKESKNEG